MTQDSKLHLSRRKMLVGLGTVGVAAAGAGLGTSAYFNDTESFENNVLTAGELNLLVSYYTYWDQGSHGSGSRFATVDGNTVAGELTDVKPGDNGILAFCFDVVDNPAYLWACGDLTANDENGQPEPEENQTTPADTTGGDPGAWEGELAQSIQVDVNYCTLAEDLGDAFGPEDLTFEADVFEGSLAEFLAMLDAGVPLDGDGDEGVLMPGEQTPYPASAEQGLGEGPCLCIDWEIPTDVGNEIQTDSVAFDLVFYAEQARHNDGTHNPCIEAEEVEGFGDAGFDPAFFGRVRNGGTNTWELAVGNGNAPGTDDNVDYAWPASTFDGSFDLVYDAANDEAVLTLYDANGGEAASVGYGDDGGESLADADGEHVAITVAASNGQVARVSNVTLNGGSPGADAVESTGATMALVLGDLATAAGFTLAGDVHFEGLGGSSDERPSMTIHVE